MKRRQLLLMAGGLVALAGCVESEPAQSGGVQTESGRPTGTEAAGTAESTPTEEDETTPSTSRAEAVIGEIVEGDNLSMVVRSVTETKQIGDFQEASEGNVFHVVGLAVKNTTQSDFINFSSFLQTTLKDSEGYNYSQTIAPTGQSLTGGQLAPGEVARGEIVFEVPEEAGGLTLQFDFQAFAPFEFDRVVVDLTQRTETIANLDQSLQVEIHDVGEAVRYDRTEVVVNDVEFTEAVSDYAEAASGNEFVIVDLTTTNNTGEEKQISTLLQMLVKDGTGSSYSTSITATSQLDRAYDESTPLAPGESRRGKIAYEVPKSAGTLYFTFEFTLWVEGDKTFWQIR